MKKYILIRKKKNSRGVAVIFTLGILGLLTVMALGFASTALLNRKIAENTSSSAYARHIAKNIAFARARWAVMTNAMSETVYTSSLSAYSDANGKTKKDFLYRMDTLLDGVEIYRVTDDSGAILDNTARWQYVTDPNDSNRILGRYAYAVVLDCGRLDPNINRGSVATRYGSSEKEVKLPGTAWSGIPDLGANRWKSFYEIMKTANITEAATKRTFFSDGIGINQQPDPETFWVDLNKDGKRTKDEMFLRFNMTRDWASTTVDQLIGKDTEALTLANAGGAASNSFIPWLKYWNHSAGSSWTADIMKKQIAANIIQYNRDESADTISDVEPDTWATSATRPTYAGIGRHPMLNELGFLVRVKTNLTADPDNAETPTKYTYTLTYYVIIDSGVELIYPFGKATGLSDSTVDITGFVELGLVGFVKQEPGAASSETDMSKIVKDYTLKSNESKLVAAGDDAADIPVDNANFQMTLSGSEAWTQTFGDYFSSDPVGAYTTRSKFWKLETNGSYASGGTSAKEFTFTFTINSATNYSDQIKEQVCVKSVVFRPGTAILTYGGKKRDFASFNDLEIFSGTQKVFDSEYVFSSCYEAKDPLVNHYPADWTSPTASGTPKHYIGAYNASNFSNQNYPGTIAKSKKVLWISYFGEGHLNSTIPGKILDETINNTKIQETATDPSYSYKNATITRLSTSYIRHGQMKSLWELGFISRAEAFKTLNLAKTKIFEPPTSPVPTTIDFLKAGGFSDGDANILDQVKFSDTTSADALYKYGKISLNSNNHNVFKQLFNTNVNWNETLRASAATDQFETGTASSAVCSASPCSGSTCLAYLLMERSKILPFSNRTDLLLDPDDDTNFAKIPGYSALSDAQQGALLTAQTNLRNFLLKTSDAATLCKAEKEQYAARFMHLFSCDPEPVRKVYIIVLAQAIKDIGGSPALVDWNGDGEYSSSALTIPSSGNDAMKKFLRTGYIRKKLYDSSNYEKIGTESSVNETIASPAVGTYDYGADKITGETKLIVEMQKDIFTNKWKIAGYRYVE